MAEPNYFPGKSIHRPGNWECIMNQGGRVCTCMPEPEKMSKDWDVVANDAMQRRAEQNFPWPGSCKGCGVKKKLSQYNPLYCNHCIKEAFDIVDKMES